MSSESNQPANQQAFQKAMNLGHSAAWDKLWEKAADYYQKALEIIPDNPMAITSLGLVYFELGEFDKSLSCYKKAAKYTPHDPVPQQKIARIYERLGQREQSVESYLQTAELYLQARDVEKAIENYKRALMLQPDQLKIRTRLAVILEKLNRKEEAVEHYLAAASILQHTGNHEKALQVARYASNLVPNWKSSQDVVKAIQTNKPLPKPERPEGDTAAVRMAEVRELKKSNQVDEEPAQTDPITEYRQKALVDLASILFDQSEGSDQVEPEDHRPQSRFSVLSGITGQNSSDKSSKSQYLKHLSKAIDLQTKELDNEAAQELEKAIDKGLDHPAGYFNLGYLIAKKDPKKAVENLSTAVKNSRYALASNLLLGDLFLRTREYKRAAAAYLEALKFADATTIVEEQSEELKQLYEPVIEAKSQQDDEEELKKLSLEIAEQLMRPDWRDFLQSAREQLPEQPEGSLPLPLGEMLIETGSSEIIDSLARVRKLAERRNLRAAMDEVFHTLSIAPTYLPLHIQIGDLLLQEGRTEQAVKKFIMVAELYALRGEVDQAIRLLKRVIKAAPLEMKIRTRLVDMLKSQSRFQEAIDELTSLAEAYYQLADFDNARVTYTQALRTVQNARVPRTKTAEILYKIADIDMQLLDWRQAIRIFEQIRTLLPEDSYARLKLVDLHFRLGHKEAALKEVREFISLLEGSSKRKAAIDFLTENINNHPEQQELRKILADLYVRNGQVQLAIGQLDKIAESLLNEGNTRGARAMLQAIVSLNPPNAAEYRNALSRLGSDE